MSFELDLPRYALVRGSKYPLNASLFELIGILIFESIEQSLKVVDNVARQLYTFTDCQLLISDVLVNEVGFFDLQLVVILEIAQDSPTRLLLHLGNQKSLKCLESLKINSLFDLVLIKVITFLPKNFL